MSSQDVPWYRGSKRENPFSFLRKISQNPNQNESSAQPFYCAAVFPWGKDALNGRLYKGADAHDEQLQTNWKEMVEKWQGSILVGSTGCFHVFRKLGSRGELTVHIPKPPQWEYSWNVQAVAWAVAPQKPTNPVAIAAVSSVLFVYDLATQEVIGRVRGHGGPITSLAVHPTEPYEFLTTSEDGTTRIYDLHYHCRQIPNNPHWPPSKRPSLAGPAFGLHASEPEGDGLGRCLAVLVGSRSGGHYGTVFHAAWHLSADLIATCGMDRCVKIWRIPPIDYAKVNVDQEHLAREDKPLFSTDLIHKARVLSINWLSSDVLASHSAPALMRGSTINDMYEIPGTITVWMWLGFGRYLPGDIVRPIMRGCQSDYRRSESFKVLAEYTLPLKNELSAFAPLYHDPLVLLDDGSTRMRIFSVAEFKPRPPPPFPMDVQEGIIEGATDRAEVPERSRHPGGSEHTDTDQATPVGVEDDEWETPPEVYKRESLPLSLVDHVDHWTVLKGPQHGMHSPESEVPLDRCQFVVDGRVIATVSENGSLSLYKLNPL